MDSFPLIESAAAVYPASAACLDNIATAVEAILVKNGVKGQVAASMAAPRRLLGLNRRSFANLLRRICKRIDLRIEASILELFVRCRNSLVHRGDYYCSTATVEERGEVPPKASRFDEYLFLMSIADAFLLRLVGYRGPYLVRTGGSEWLTKHV